MSLTSKDPGASQPPTCASAPQDMSLRAGSGTCMRITCYCTCMCSPAHRCSCPAYIIYQSMLPQAPAVVGLLIHSCCLSHIVYAVVVLSWLLLVAVVAIMEAPSAAANSTGQPSSCLQTSRETYCRVLPTLMGWQASSRCCFGQNTLHV